MTTSSRKPVAGAPVSSNDVAPDAWTREVDRSPPPPPPPPPPPNRPPFPPPPPPPPPYATYAAVATPATAAAVTSVFRVSFPAALAAASRQHSRSSAARDPSPSENASHFAHRRLGVHGARPS
jgi:hypothetical protein